MLFPCSGPSSSPARSPGLPPRHTHVLAVVQHDGAAVTPRGDVVSHGAPGRVHQGRLVPRRVLLPLQRQPHRLRAGLGTQQGQPRPAAAQRPSAAPPLPEPFPAPADPGRPGRPAPRRPRAPLPGAAEGKLWWVPPATAASHPALDTCPGGAACCGSAGTRWGVPAQQNAGLGLYLQTMLWSSSNFRQG